jgi:uncharacterized cofD-like protein
MNVRFPRARLPMQLRRWLTPGIGVKRWLLVAFVGLLLLAVAGAHFIRQVTRDVEPGSTTETLVDLITLQFLPYALRGFLVAVVGVALIAIGLIRVARALIDPVWSSDTNQPLVEVIYQKRFLARGPRIVAIGGGTGLSTLLRGLKEHTSNLTAVVTVADDGGSSGVLRNELGIPPVGDIRNCIVALADAEPLMAELLQYRFPGVDAGAARDSTNGDRAAPEAGLRGHAVGNLLIAAMAAIENDDFEEGVRRMNRVLAVRGEVLPVASAPLTLHARLRDGTTIDGQSRIAAATGIERVWLTPSDVEASDGAVAAIAEADLIVVGPGSLYTSLLPSLLVPGIRDAVAASPALRVLVCNVATQRGETSGYDLAAHVEALSAHSVAELIDVVLANNQFGARSPSSWHAERVKLRWPPAGSGAPRLVLDDVVDPDNAHHHDPERLAVALLRVLDREGQRRRTAAATPRTA